MLRVSFSVSHTCAHPHTYSFAHKDNSVAFILFSPSSVSVVSDTVNLSQFPPLIIIKKRKLLHSPLNTPTRLLLLGALKLSACMAGWGKALKKGFLYLYFIFIYRVRYKTIKCSQTKKTIFYNETKDFKHTFLQKSVSNKYYRAASVAKL